MIVEDDDVNLLVLQLMLKQEGYETIAAVDGPAAIELADTHRPSLVLMDLSMPKMDGITAANAIRRRLNEAAPLFVAVTAHVTPHHRQLCEEAEFVDFVEKPIDRQRLFAIIRRILDEDRPADHAMERRRFLA
ncbi:MAG: response regulator [Pseudomonadota bacterium]